MPPPGFASDFPVRTVEDWRRLAEAVLKGADFDKTLVSKSLDGIRISPIYPKAEGGGVAGRAAHAPWRVTQRMDQPDPAAANEQALADLAGGADSLALLYAGAAGARGFGVPAPGVADLEPAAATTSTELPLPRNGSR